MAYASLFVGPGNIILMIVYLLGIQSDDPARGLRLPYGIIAANLVVILVGVGLRGLYRTAWVTFYIIGFVLLPLAAEHCYWLHVHKGGIDPLPLISGIASACWYFPSGICLLLPSIRKYFFNEPDSIRMQKSLMRKHSRQSGVSGRPKKPPGLVMVSSVALVIAAGLFLYAMSELAEESLPENPDQPASGEVIGLMVAFAVGIAVASAGLCRAKRWGWYGTMAYAILTVVVVAVVLLRQTGSDADATVVIKNPYFLLCLLWCGTAIFYLMLPHVRHACLSRRHSRRRH